MKDFWERNCIHSRLPILFREVDHTGTEGHFDFDEGLITVRKQVLGLAGVNTNNAEEEMSAGPECLFDL